MISPLRLYLIRHGRPGAGFAEAVDPGLDEIGREQARTIAEELSSLGPLSLITSPLKRARETALPFETRWGIAAHVESRIAERTAHDEFCEPSALAQRRLLLKVWIADRARFSEIGESEPDDRNNQ